MPTTEEIKQRLKSDDGENCDNNIDNLQISAEYHFIYRLHKRTTHNFFHFLYEKNVLGNDIPQVMVLRVSAEN